MGIDPATEALALERVRAGNVSGACIVLGRNPAPIYFEIWRGAGLVSDVQLRDQLLSLWEMAEYPCRVLPRRKWLEWFRTVGFVSSDGAPAPTAPIEVWRAQVGRTLGLSWTRSREKAVWFHNRNARLTGARILHGFAPPAAVLGMVHGPDSRGEDEVIVDPAFMPKENGK